MINNYPYLEFIKIAKECRNILIEDTLYSNSPDLYDALYSDTEKEIYKTKLELYQIKWIELHWKKINESLENKKFSISEKKKLISIFAKWYKDFISNWNYTEFDTTIFKEKINILETIVFTNNEWENNLKKIKVSFEKDKKMLNEKIKKLKMEED